KRVIKSSSTNSFKIHRSLLRPRDYELNYYPLSHDSFGYGYGGGVILIEVFPNGQSIDVKYYFTDGLILSAFAAGIFENKWKNRNEAVIKSFKEFQNYRKIGGTVTLCRSCFIEFSSIKYIFAYSGFQIGDGVRYNLLRAVGKKYGLLIHEADKKFDFETWKSSVHNHFHEMIVWNELKHSSQQT
ncbi:MAG TPA: hypothetical protein DCM38_02135, partial [Gammaproteobacteria bacterium]|nr:hypothetical protein [Gammaproteobacteria bacterium]